MDCGGKEKEDVDERKARMLLVIVMIRVYGKYLENDQWKLRRMGVSLWTLYYIALCVLFVCKWMCDGDLFVFLGDFSVLSMKAR